VKLPSIDLIVRLAVIAVAVAVTLESLNYMVWLWVRK
jgi:hypothetical protein